MNNFKDTTNVIDMRVEFENKQALNHFNQAEDVMQALKLVVNKKKESSADKYYRELGEFGDENADTSR